MFKCVVNFESQKINKQKKIKYLITYNKIKLIFFDFSFIITIKKINYSHGRFIVAKSYFFVAK